MPESTVIISNETQKIGDIEKTRVPCFNESRICHHFYKITDGHYTFNFPCYIKCHAADAKL